MRQMTISLLLLLFVASVAYSQANPAGGFTPSSGIDTDHGAGAIDATTDFAAALCGTNEILEDQGASWACIATPAASTDTLSAGDSSFVLADAGAGTATATIDAAVVGTWKTGGLTFAATKALKFGDEDTYIYEWTDDQLSFAFAGTDFEWLMTGTTFGVSSGGTSGPALSQGAGTNCDILPQYDDANTCIYRNTEDTFYIQVGGASFIEIVESAADQMLLNHLVNGQLYETDDAGTNSITVTTEGTYYGWTTATAGPLNGNMTADVADATADHLTVPVAGDYHISWSASFSGTASTTFIIGASVNETISVCRTSRKLGTGGDVGVASSGACLLALSANDRVALMVTCTESPGDCSGDSLSVYGFAIYASRVGS